MASKPETTFIKRVHRSLEGPYAEKNHNGYRGGTPDVWYSGDRGDLWVEYKYLPKLPARKPILPTLSALQAKWLAERAAEGRNVAVIVGTPTGGVIYRSMTWEHPLTTAEFCARLATTKHIADWIYSQTGDRVICKNTCLS